jgi:hypothetical protein
MDECIVDFIEECIEPIECMGIGLADGEAATMTAAMMMFSMPLVRRPHPLG